MSKEIVIIPRTENNGTCLAKLIVYGDGQKRGFIGNESRLSRRVTSELTLATNKRVRLPLSKKINNFSTQLHIDFWLQNV